MLSATIFHSTIPKMHGRGIFSTASLIKKFTTPQLRDLPKKNRREKLFNAFSSTERSFFAFHVQIA
jgi:hypothetical protein